MDVGHCVSACHNPYCEVSGGGTLLELGFGLIVI